MALASESTDRPAAMILYILGRNSLDFLPPAMASSRYTAASRLRSGVNPYDVHCYWPEENSDARRKALELRERLHKRFPWMIRTHVREKPRGPHSCPYWEADFGLNNANMHSEVVMWLTNNRVHGLSVLIHPNTTDGVVADHRQPNAIWVGEPIVLREWAFYRPYAEGAVAAIVIAIVGGLWFQYGNKGLPFDLDFPA